MKQISKTIRKDFKMPLIFRDDLEAIEKILKDNQSRDFKIKTSDFEFDSVAEIDVKTKSRNEVSILSYGPYISIDFNKHSTYLHASDSEIRTIGIVSKIEEIIKKRERKLRWLSSKLSVWFAGPIFVVAFEVVTKLKERGFQESRWYGLVILLLIIIWWVRDFRHSLHSFSEVIFMTQDDQKSFFIRKKDEIILVVITVILTLVSTIIVQKLFK